MDCEGFQDALLAAPSAADAGPAGAGHARGCSGCAAFLAQTQAIEAALRPGALPVAPRRVRTALFEELRRLHPEPERPGWDWGALLSPPRLAWAAGFAAVLVFAVRVVPPRSGHGDGLSASKVYVAVLEGDAATAD